jgi:hypothetical protein
LFVDFDATACVIIKDPSEFAGRLRAAGAKYFSGSDSQDGKVIFDDPLLPEPKTRRIRHSSVAKNLGQPLSSRPRRSGLVHDFSPLVAAGLLSFLFPRTAYTIE